MRGQIEEPAFPRSHPNYSPSEILSPGRPSHPHPEEITPKAAPTLVWGGHSCPPPLTLLLTRSLPREGHDFSRADKAKKIDRLQPLRDPAAEGLASFSKGKESLAPPSPGGAK
jgi:hypothetical protein